MYDPASRETAGPLQSLTGSLLVVTAVLALTGATLVITLDVILRYIFNSPLLWSLELNEMLLPLLVFGCMPYVWERRNHVHMEMVVRLFPAHGVAACDLVTALCGGLFSALLAVGMAKNALDMFKYNQRGEYILVPFWPLGAFVAAIGAVMTLQFLILGLSAIGRLVRR